MTVLPLPQMPQGLARVMNLGHLLSQTARKYPHRPGFIQGDTLCTWSQISARVDAADRKIGLSREPESPKKSDPNLR